MTEKLWLASSDPAPLLKWLRRKASPRRLRLFAAACCRRAWHLLRDARSREAVEAAEGHADGLAGAEELVAAQRAAGAVWQEAWDGLRGFTDAETDAANAACSAAGADAHQAATGASLCAANAAAGRGADDAPERAAQCELLRDVGGGAVLPSRCRRGARKSKR